MAPASPSGVMVDSCVLLDVITADPQWETWSGEHLASCLTAGPVTINVDEALPCHIYNYRPIPREAAFLAARADAAYRSRGGTRQMILPDFLIGAHAVIERFGLLTRDAHRYRQAPDQ